MMDFPPGLVVGTLVILVTAWGFLTYNKLIRLRQLISNSWSNVESELRRRYDLIPNIVETVKGYAAHEAATIESVVVARQAALETNGEDPQVQAPPERNLVASLRGLLALAEDYPDLKASAHFLDLQRELANTEDRIQLARRIYNANVRDSNIAVESFPSRLIASLGGFSRSAFFEMEPAVEPAPQVDLG